MTSPGELGTNPAAASGFVCAVLAVLAALFLYWLWVPSIALGAVAVGLGVVGRRRALTGSPARDIAGGSPARDMAVAAIALGLVAVLMTPAVNGIAKGEEDYGRKCALNPEHPDC